MTIIKDRTSLNVVLIGGSGAIGGALLKGLAGKEACARIHALGRTPVHNVADKVTFHRLDLLREEQIKATFDEINDDGPVDLLIYACGLLHKGNEIQPEKALGQLDERALHEVFHLNAIAPMLVMKQAQALLDRKNGSVWGFLSARVGSISDNRLGGWYGYRASKAALNMAVKTASVELARFSPNSSVLALHPGTVDSRLSKPFQARVQKDKLFTPDFSATCLLNILFNATPRQSGRIWAWDGQEIMP